MSLWLNRSLFTGPHLALVKSQKQFQKALKALGVTDTGKFCNDGADATTHSYISAKGNLACIVGIRKHKGRNKSEIHGLLVHEAVHVWQQTRNEICDTYGNEGNLGREFEAYAIQNIAQNLMEAWGK